MKNTARRFSRDLMGNRKETRGNRKWTGGEEEENVKQKREENNGRKSRNQPIDSLIDS